MYNFTCVFVYTPCAISTDNTRTDLRKCISKPRLGCSWRSTVFQNELLLCVLRNEHLVSFQEYWRDSVSSFPGKVWKTFSSFKCLRVTRSPAYVIWLLRWRHSSSCVRNWTRQQLPVWWMVFYSWQSIRQRIPKSHLHVHKIPPSCRGLNQFSPV